MSANTEGASILALAETILEQTKGVTKYLQANDLAAPTFSPKARSSSKQSSLSGASKQLEDVLGELAAPRRWPNEVLPIFLYARL